MRTAGRERLITGETICYSFGKGCGDWLHAHTHTRTPFHYLTHTSRRVTFFMCGCCEESSPFWAVTHPPPPRPLPLQPEDTANAVAASRCWDYGLSDAVAATSPARPLKCWHSDAMSARQAVGGCFLLPLFISSIFPFSSSSSHLKRINSIGNQQGRKRLQPSISGRCISHRFLSPQWANSPDKHNRSPCRVAPYLTETQWSWRDAVGQVCAQRFCKIATAGAQETFIRGKPQRE